MSRQQLDAEAGMMAMKRCDALQVEAAACMSRGEPLAASDKYLEAVAISRGIYTQNRLHCMQHYEQIMTSQFAIYKTLSEKHLATVTRIAEDKDELNVFRITCNFVLGMNYWALCQFDEAAKRHRDICDLVEDCRDKSQTNRNVPKVMWEGIPYPEYDIPIYEYAADGVTLVPVNLGSYIETLEKKAKTCLALGQNATSVPFLRNDMKSRWGDDDSLIDRMGAGGGKCDCCGRKAETMDGGELLQCARCKMAYYCSVTCQKQQWRAGHKQACRTPDQIEQDDIMLVKGIVSKPELNRKLVKIVRPSGDGRWEVNVQGANNNISLAAKNLVHIRPSK